MAASNAKAFFDPFRVDAVVPVPRVGRWCDQPWAVIFYPFGVVRIAPPYLDRNVQ